MYLLSGSRGIGTLTAARRARVVVLLMHMAGLSRHAGSQVHGQVRWRCQGAMGNVYTSLPRPRMWCRITYGLCSHPEKEGVNNGVAKFCGAPLAHPRPARLRAGARSAGAMELARSALGHCSERARAAHRGCPLPRTAHSNLCGDPTLCAPAAVPQTGPAHQAQHHKRAPEALDPTTNERPATCTQRAARARCTHTPPAPPSQCTRSLDLKSLAGNFQAANSMASGMEAVRRARAATISECGYNCGSCQRDRNRRSSPSNQRRCQTAQGREQPRSTSTSMAEQCSAAELQPATCIHTCIRAPPRVTKPGSAVRHMQLTVNMHTCTPIHTYTHAHAHMHTRGARTPGSTCT